MVLVLLHFRSLKWVSSLVDVKESRNKTTFVIREGSFRFRVMPFWLTGAPATFQRLMDAVMSGLNLEVCLVYLDDIIVYSADVGTHLK